MTKKIAVLVAGDHAVERKGLVSLLAAAGSMSVIGEAANGDETLYLSMETQPQVLLLDQKILQKEGPGLIWRVWRENAGVTVLVMGNRDQLPELTGRFDAGLLGFVDTNASMEELTRVISEAANYTGTAST